MPRRAIAHILPWGNVGGTELATLRLAEALRAGGYENVVYVPRLPGAESVVDLVRESGFPFARYAQVAPRKANPLPFLANITRLALDFARRGVGLVHGADLAGAYFTARAARLSGARATSHVRCAHPRLAAVEHWLLKPVERFVFVSHATVEEQDFACPPSAADVLYDAALPPASYARAQARAHYGLPADALVLGMAARIHPQKDHASLIRAAALLKPYHPGLRVLMVGDHRDTPAHRTRFAELECLMAETGTRDMFVFPGFEAQMPRFYAALDVCLLASHTEGFPLGILEAMGAGLPVIASNVGGVREAVEDGVTGMLVGDADVPGFAAAIRRLAEDPALIARMGAAARDAALGRFGPERFAREAQAFARRMLGPAVP
ncbi:MAG: glycosyltransferase family 4 protein [Pseudomonadota bacterium]